MRTWRVYVTTQIERLQEIEAEDAEEAENLARDAAEEARFWPELPAGWEYSQLEDWWEVTPEYPEAANEGRG